MASPIDQFEITRIVPIQAGSIDLSFTNSAAYMVLTVARASGFLLYATWKPKRALVPDRLQSTGELLYEFVDKTIGNAIGSEGKRFFPLVFALFTFILTANMIGMFPYAFTVTSHIIVTFALAMLVFGTVTIYGFVRNSPKFFRLFLPSGVPMALAPIIVPIEIVSSRGPSASRSACSRSCLRAT